MKSYLPLPQSFSKRSGREASFKLGCSKCGVCPNRLSCLRVYHAEEVWQILFSSVLPHMRLFLPLHRFLAPVKDIAVLVFSPWKALRSQLELLFSCALFPHLCDKLLRGHSKLVRNGDGAWNVMERCHGGVKKKNRCRMELWNWKKRAFCL